MKLILHVGMPKAGSTALQRGLRRLHDRLLDRGWLYPAGWRAPHHNFLVAAVVPPEKLSSDLRRGREPTRVARDLETWIDDIGAQVARHRPKALLMSAEGLFGLFRQPRPDRCAKLAAVLRQLADEIEVVAYLRKPSDFYLSVTQQTLKSRHRIPPPAPVHYRAPLEGFAAIAGCLRVFKYDRALFPGGDVLRHFVETICPDMAGEALPRLAANVSLRAEGISILAAYRRCHHSDKPYQFTSDTNRLLMALGKADADLPAGGRARLKEDLARTIDEGSTDLLWLRDTHGIEFDGIDYARIAPMVPGPRPERIDEICALDKEREAKAALHALRHLADNVVRLRAAGSVRSKPGRGKPAARAGWWRSVLRPLVGTLRP